MFKMIFQNPELQKIYEDSQPFVKAHLDRLDSISSDIKLLEGLLNNSALHSLEIVVDKSQRLEFTSNRIRYCKLKNENFFELKPLIECSSIIRLKMEPYLSLLFDKAMQAIGYKKQEVRGE